MTDSIATPSTGDDAFGVDHGIIDVEFEAKKARFHFGRVLAIGMIGGIVVALLFFVVMVLLQQSDRVLIFVSTAVVILIFGLWLRWVTRRNETDRIAKLCENYQDSETPNVVTGMVSDFDRSGESLVAAPLVDVLTRMQRFGSVVRCAPPDSRVALRPFMVPFEPLVLDEADEATAALMEGFDKGRRIATDDADSNLNVSPASNVYLQVRRALRLDGRFGVWMTRGLWLLMLIVYFLIGHTTSFLFFLGLTLLFIVAKLTAETCWLVSPGALVIRGGHWRSSGASLRRYMRSEAVLVVHQMAEDVWQVAVGDRESQYVRSCTSAEIDLLLRCWLSPLAPLPIDRYSDFGDSA